MPLHATLRDGELQPTGGPPDLPARSSSTEELRVSAKPMPVQSEFNLDKPIPLKILGAGHPIHDHRKKVWCVRSPGRMESGPIKASQLWELIQSGSLDPDAMVWREDWDDWFAAGAVFPELQSSASGVSEAKSRRAISGAAGGFTSHIWSNLPAIVGAIIAIAILVFLTVVILIVANS